MANGNLDRTRSARPYSSNDSASWAKPERTTYRCPVYLSRREDGGYSAIAPVLADTHCEGATEDEALENITRILEDAIHQFTSRGPGMPWIASPSAPEPGMLFRFVFPKA